MIRVQATGLSGELLELEFSPQARLAELRRALEQKFEFPGEYLQLSVDGASLLLPLDSDLGDVVPPRRPPGRGRESEESEGGEGEEEAQAEERGVVRVGVVKSLEAVLQEMASDDASVQERVLERLIQSRALPQLRDRRVLQVLIDHVAEHGIGRARGYVAVALRQLLTGYDNPCQPELLALLDHTRAEVRQRGVEALGLSTSRRCADAIGAARACLQDPVLSVRGEAIVALTHLGDAETAMVPTLVAEHIMSGSACQLMEFHYLSLRQGFDMPQQSTQEGLASIAEIAFYRDVRTFSPHTLRKLAEYAEDENANVVVRGSALEGLWYLLHTQEEKGIARGLMAAHACIVHPSAVVRHMAIKLIGTHGFRGSEQCAEQAMQALYMALRDEDGRVQAQALEDMQAHLASTEDAELQKALKMMLAESTRFLWSLKHMVFAACAGSAGSNGSWLCHYA